jgi:hypothetical protein
MSKRSRLQNVMPPVRTANRVLRIALALVACVATWCALSAAPVDAGMRYVRSPYPGSGTAPGMEQAIRSTWPSKLHRAAMNVAWCESGGRAGARNGQYKGHFQIGRSEWARFGAGSPFNAIDNSAAAYRYYRAVGSWRPWQCQP